jgi:hypothetical protein
MSTAAGRSASLGVGDLFLEIVRRHQLLEGRACREARDDVLARRKDR